MRHLSVLLFLFALLFPAAAVAQIPVWCFTYGFNDSFEGSDANQWIPWNNSNTGVIDVGSTGSARTGSNAALLSFANSETLNSFLLIDRVVHVADTTTRERTKRFGCSHVIPWVPFGHPKYCAASVWLKSAGDGASGFFQLIDPISYSYIALASFSNSSPGVWFKVSIPVTSGCLREMIVRVGISRTSAASDALVVDDVHIDWHY